MVYCYMILLSLRFQYCPIIIKFLDQAICGLFCPLEEYADPSILVVGVLCFIFFLGCMYCPNITKILHFSCAPQIIIMHFRYKTLTLSKWYRNLFLVFKEATLNQSSTLKLYAHLTSSTRTTCPPHYNLMIIWRNVTQSFGVYIYNTALFN
jgi:hypothetical protein